MNEPPENKLSRRISRSFLIWLASFLLIALISGIVLSRTDGAPNKFPDIVWSLVFGFLGASILVCLLAFICWLNCWRNLRLALIGLAVLATLIALFYTEEDWRGKYDWENCQRELEAQGVVMDWDKFLPPSVPDDQNFYTASTNILLRFRQIPEGETNEIKAVGQLQWLNLSIRTNGVYLFPIFDNSKGKPLVIAKIIFLPPAVSIPAFDTNICYLALNDPALPEKLQNIIQTRIGQTTDGVMGFEFSQFQLTNIQPVQIIIGADTPPSLDEVDKLIPSGIVKKFALLQIIPMADPRSFKVQLANVRITSATDYLRWTDQFVPAFDEIRTALKRPYAILPGDYSQPYRMPFPNFVTTRALAQTLTQRAQCYLLLGEPDKALPEMTLVHDVCRVLEEPPDGKPETLVAAMINVAITALYEQIVADALQHHEWQQPQVEALQQQLAQINLAPHVFEAFQEMPAGIARDAEIIPPQQWYSSLTADENADWPTKAAFWLMPRGWVYQNIITVVQLKALSWNGFDAASGMYSPQTFDASEQKRQAVLGHRSPYHLLAAISVPNYTKAWQVTAYDQTEVNETQIACALERYHLAHGEYPGTLDVLVPQFIQTIPNDLIGGQRLHYHRTDDGKFSLYSVGWNGTDDGGQPSPRNAIGGMTDYAHGDWVWASMP